MGKLVVRDLEEYKYRFDLRELSEDFRPTSMLTKIMYLDDLCIHYYSADTPAAIAAEHGKIQRICVLLDRTRDLDRDIICLRRSKEATTADIEWLRISMSQQVVYHNQIADALKNVNVAMVVAYLKQRAIDAGDLIEV